MGKDENQELKVNKDFFSSDSCKILHIYFLPVLTNQISLLSNHMEESDRTQLQPYTDKKNVPK